mmetsp:Transcript_19100/g.27157  ORF Transcript_19100/g.27157 Transcript_19100/m.27157 type:complete len:322 (+) Transcript_19100:69-1034(+)|eukprot:CAMPEP_0172421250 /NCGR_PEP_ID=MMETSP1064-20121228/7515_1 /TAXON_ID=202472 /ORGANISM="Aulacoseira subarctica , Strain CCAP 1002/5" /LENGTH=321 /DNA_ID=CAMNT_0013161551 /DNA_START=47 /DNA_END=1012 /DNA_ORIENTATION=+
MTRILLSIFAVVSFLLSSSDAFAVQKKIRLCEPIPSLSVEPPYRCKRGNIYSHCDVTRRGLFATTAAAQEDLQPRRAMFFHMRNLKQRLFSNAINKRFPPMKRYRQVVSSILLVCFITLSTIRLPATSSVFSAHASTSAIEKTSIIPMRSSLSYEDKLVQRYIEKHMFQDDKYEPFESTYKEITLYDRLGVKPELETLEDFGVSSNEVATTTTKKDAGLKKKKDFSLWNIFLVLNLSLSNFFHKALKLSSKKSTQFSFYTIAIGTVSVILCGGQFAFFQLKNFLFNKEGERYGGRDYSADEKDPDELDEEDDDDDDDDEEE